MNRKDRPLCRKEALERILESCAAVGTETASLDRAAGRVLRKPVAADRDVPPFDRATMDGWAVRSEDLKYGSARLSVAAEIRAGSAFGGRLGPGFCAKIMTGAPMPAGADSVVKIEDSRILADDTVMLEPAESGPGTFVHPKGRDIKGGMVAVPAGAALGRFEIAALASFGAVRPEVAARVRVSILSTGAEVLPPGSRPEPFQIRNATGPALQSMLGSRAWLAPAFAGIAGDDEKPLCRMLKKAMAGCDVLAVTGGVSKGDFDLVPAILESLGARRIFHGLAMRPGRPLWFGAVRGGPLVFGLPGNPVSVFVAAHLFLLPALGKIAGMSNPLPLSMRLRLGIPWRKDHPLEEARIARISAEKGGLTSVTPMEYSGSADFIAAAKSDGLAFIPAEASCLKAGTAVEYQPWQTQV